MRLQAYEEISFRDKVWRIDMYTNSVGSMEDRYVHKQRWILSSTLSLSNRSQRILEKVRKLSKIGHN